MSEQVANIKFVQEVEKHPCLYNYELAEYSRKDITENAWNEVGKQVNLTGNQCKEKWRNLRAVFVRHMKPVSVAPPTKKRKPYYLAHAMQFTLPYIKVLNPTTSENFSNSNHQEATDYEDDDEDRPIEEDMTNASPPATQRMIFVPMSSSEKQSSFEFKNIFHKFDDMNDSEERACSGFPKAKMAKVETSPDLLQESKKMFLLSLLPDLNEMSNTQMRTFRRRVVSLVDQILQEAPDTRTSLDVKCVRMRQDSSFRNNQHSDTSSAMILSTHELEHKEFKSEGVTDFVSNNTNTNCNNYS